MASIRLYVDSCKSWEMNICYTILFYVYKNCLYLFIEREEKREEGRKRNIKVWEKHQSVASHMPPNQQGREGVGDRGKEDPGMYPEQELNRWTFSLQ